MKFTSYITPIYSHPSNPRHLQDKQLEAHIRSRWKRALALTPPMARHRVKRRKHTCGGPGAVGYSVTRPLLLLRLSLSPSFSLSPAVPPSAIKRRDVGVVVTCLARKSHRQQRRQLTRLSFPGRHPEHTRARMNIYKRAGNSARALCGWRSASRKQRRKRLIR